MLKAILFDFGDTLALESSTGPDELRRAPSAERVLKELSKSFRLGVVSNTTTWKEEDIRDALRQMGLEEYFDAVITSVDIDSPKPEPGIFREIMRRLGVRAEECMMVGDRRDADILGGNRLGMTTVHIVRDADSPHFVDELEKADHAIGSLREILDLVRRR
jgi:putative hydrolase of the HAD superfamily